MSPALRPLIITALSLLATTLASPHCAHAAKLDMEAQAGTGRVWLEQARAARKSLDYARALDLYRRAAILPGTEEPGTVGIAQIQQINGENEQALATLKDYLSRLDPFGIDVHLALVDLYLNLSRDADADKEMAIIDRLRPGYGPANERAGVIAYRKGNYRLAVAALTKLLDRVPGHARALELRARSYLALEKYSSALADYKTLQTVEPDNIDTYLSIGRIYVQLGEHEGAEPYVAAALAASEVSPAQRVKILVLAGDFAQLRGDQKKAAGYFRRAYDSDATDLKLGLQLSELYFRSHNFPQAQQTFDKIIATAPKDESVLKLGLRLSDLYVAAHQFREAQRVLARVMEAAPEDEAAARRMMELYNLSGQRDGLGTFLRNYLAAHPAQSWAAVAYAKLLLEVDDRANAERVLVAATGEKNTNLTPETALLLAKTIQLQNRPQDALAVVQKAVDKFPADDRLRFDLALTYEKLNEPGRAASEYAKVSRRDATLHQKACVNLALIHERAGDLGKAYTTLRAIEPGPSGMLPAAILAKIERLSQQLSPNREGGNRAPASTGGGSP